MSSYAVRTATKHDTSKGSSCPVAIGNALLDMYEEFQKEIVPDDEFETKDKKENVNLTNSNTKISKPKCPQCGGDLVFEGGCNTCKNCGWSKCD